MDTQTSSEPVAVKPDKAPIDWTGIALFIVLTFGLSWVIWPGSSMECHSPYVSQLVCLDPPSQQQ